MNLKPFLTQFAIRRDDCVDFSNVVVKYNEDFDYNEISTRSRTDEFNCLSSGTTTKVKAESPDIDSSSFIYLDTQTSTAVEAEKPDEPSDAIYKILLSTKTITEVKPESADED